MAFLAEAINKAEFGQRGEVAEASDAPAGEGIEHIRLGVEQANGQGSKPGYLFAGRDDGYAAITARSVKGGGARGGNRDACVGTGFSGNGDGDLLGRAEEAGEAGGVQQDGGWIKDLDSRREFLSDSGSGDAWRMDRDEHG